MPKTRNKISPMRILNPNSMEWQFYTYVYVFMCPIGIGHMGNLQLAAVLGYQHNQDAQ